MAESRSSGAKVAPFTMLSTSILGRIHVDLAALAPEQFLAPPHQAPDNSTSLGAMTDYERRLWTLYSLAFEDHDKLQREQSALQRQINRAATKGKDFLDHVKNLASGGLDPGVIDTYRANDRLLLQKLHYMDLVGALFWDEITLRFGDQTEGNHSIGVYSDWTVATTPERDDGLPGEFADMLGDALGEALGIDPSRMSFKVHRFGGDSPDDVFGPDSELLRSLGLGGARRRHRAREDA